MTFQIAGLELTDGGFEIGGRRKFRWTESDLIAGDWYSTTKTHRLIMIIMECPNAREAKKQRPTISISRDILYCPRHRSDRADCKCKILLRIAVMVDW